MVFPTDSLVLLFADVWQVPFKPELTATELSRAFWTSDVMRLERKILAAANVGKTRTDEEIRSMNFTVGEQVGPFVVASPYSVRHWIGVAVSRTDTAMLFAGGCENRLRGVVLLA